VFLNSSVDFCTLETKCAYLKDERARMRYKYILSPTSFTNDSLTHRGWRRFGEYYSIPKCNGCNKCLSLRVNALEFKFSKNAKRVLKKNLNTKIIMRPPSVTKEHLELYDLYHKERKESKNWDFYNISAQSYYELYVLGHGDFGKEVLYFVDNKLVAVDLIDFLSDGISSIYCYYDPSYAHLSLGKFSLYQQILICKVKKLPWVYLGYFVEDCPSLSYKANYKPFELLKNNPALQEEPIWE
jgi:arginine-tRNA-protein transferase